MTSKISKKIWTKLGNLGQSTFTKNATTNRSFWVAKKDLLWNIPEKLWYMKQVSQVININHDRLVAIVNKVSRIHSCSETPNLPYPVNKLLVKKHAKLFIYIYIMIYNSRKLVCIAPQLTSFILLWNFASDNVTIKMKMDLRNASHCQSMFHNK